MREDRARHDRVAFAVRGPPQLAAVFHIVAADESAAGADDLRRSAYLDRERRGKGERLLCGRIARGFPPHRAGRRIKRRDERIRSAVAAENERVAREDRRAAGAVDGFVGKARLLPDHLPGEVQRRRAHVAEMDIEPVRCHHRRSAGGGVLGVHRGDTRGVRAKDFRIPDHASVRGVEAERAQGFVRVTCRRGEVKPPAREHRRRPASAGNLRAPRHARRGAPLDGHIFRGGKPLAGRPAELRPLGLRRAGMGENERQQRE